MNISQLPFDKRLDFESKELQKHVLLPSNKRIVDGYVQDNNVFILQFDDYTLKCVLNPVKRPNCYWIGPAPNHRFYKNDSNGELTPYKRTNLSNTRFGVYSLWYTPDKTLIDIVERIKYSMTSKGEKNIECGMF